MTDNEIFTINHFNKFIIIPKELEKIVSEKMARPRMTRNVHNDSTDAIEDGDDEEDDDGEYEEDDDGEDEEVGDGEDDKDDKDYV